MLVELDTLNVSNNLIEKIDNLDKLVKLRTLQIANNELQHVSGMHPFVLSPPTYCNSSL